MFADLTKYDYFIADERYISYNVRPLILGKHITKNLRKTTILLFLSDSIGTPLEVIKHENFYFYKRFTFFHPFHPAPTLDTNTEKSEV